MITVKDKLLGECELRIDVGYSSVDSFIDSGYCHDLGRELTDDEIERFNTDYNDEIQEYSYTEGGSRNHN